MWSYALSTPIKKGIWIPPSPEKFSIPPSSTEKTTDHHIMKWLINKNPNYGIFPQNSESGRQIGKHISREYK